MKRPSSWRALAYWAILLTACLQIEGCTPVPESAPKTEIIPEVLCLPQYQYARQLLTQAADETQRYAEQIPALMRLVGDYEYIRTLNAKCIAESKLS